MSSKSAKHYQIWKHCLTLTLHDGKSVLANDLKTQLTEENVTRKYAKTEQAELYQKANEYILILVQDIESYIEQLASTLHHIKSQLGPHQDNLSLKEETEGE